MTQTKATPMALMVSIVTRGAGDKLAGFLTQNGAVFNFMFWGNGTANKKILNYLGLVENKKDILLSAVTYAQLPGLMRAVSESEFNLDAPGHGIAFCVPVNNAALNIEQGGTAMEHDFTQDLIVAITTQGYADEVMDVARTAGATGGTIIKARGAGAEKAEKFFGITIQPEKELLFIVTPTENRGGIMTAIAAKSGMHTDANTIVFSLPVSDVAGISFVDPEARTPHK